MKIYDIVSEQQLDEFSFGQVGAAAKGLVKGGIGNVRAAYTQKGHAQQGQKQAQNITNHLIQQFTTMMGGSGREPSQQDLITFLQSHSLDTKSIENGGAVTGGKQNAPRVNPPVQNNQQQQTPPADNAQQPAPADNTQQPTSESYLGEKWSAKYKKSINCSHPKGFSQKAHCAGKKKNNENMMTMEMTCPDCGMCETHGNLNEIKKGQKDSNGFTKCWPNKHAEGTKKGKNGGWVRKCVPNESVTQANLKEEESDYYRDYKHGLISYDEYQQLVRQFQRRSGHHHHSSYDDQPVMKGMYFYDVKPGEEDAADLIGVKKTKSGRWALIQYDTSGRTFNWKKQRADQRFGQGKFWSPKKESVAEDATNLAQHANPNAGALRPIDVKNMIMKVVQANYNRIMSGDSTMDANDPEQDSFQAGGAAPSGGNQNQANNQQAQGNAEPDGRIEPSLDNTQQQDNQATPQPGAAGSQDQAGAEQGQEQAPEKATASSMVADIETADKAVQDMWNKYKDDQEAPKYNFKVNNALQTLKKNVNDIADANNRAVAGNESKQDLRRPITAFESRFFGHKI